MSYEGSVEFLCARGHHQDADAFDSHPEVCGQHGCMKQIEWQHAIDRTNGFDAEDPGTYHAPVMEIGWDDIPMTDHRGNAYYVKHVRVQPAEGSAWIKTKPTEEENAAALAEYTRKRAIFGEPADKCRIFSGEKLLFATDSEVEFNTKYEEFLAQGLPNLSGYAP